MKAAESKIIKLNATIDDMKANCYIIAADMEERKRVELEEIVDYLCNGLQGGSYPEHVRDFCLTTHYYSLRAYQYIRDKFNNHLPHDSTLRAWCRNSDIDVTPGVIKSDFNVLKEKAKAMKENGKQMVVSLKFDEMCIRKHIQWCSAARAYLGYATYGDFDDDIPIANQAIVFMVSGLNEFFQIKLHTTSLNHLMQINEASL